MSKNQFEDLPVNDRSKAIAAIIAPEAKAVLNADTGAAALGKEILAKILPEGLTPEHLKQVSDFYTDAMTGTMLAAGEVAVPALKKHKSLESVHVTLPLTGRDNLGVKIDRSRTVPHRSEDGVHGTRQKFGSSTQELNLFATRNRGDLAKAKNWVSEQATGSFGS